MAYKNLHLHNEIRSWTTEQLIETLEFNGLGECSDAIATKQIDGEEFLNLSEGQLALWRNVLNTTQTRRLWSIIQLAKERPQDFVRSNSQKSTPFKQPASTKPNVPTVPRNTPLPPTIPVQFEQPAPTMPTVTRNTPLPPTATVMIEQSVEQMRNIAPLPGKPEKFYDNLPAARVVDNSPATVSRNAPVPFPTKPAKFDEQFVKPAPNRPPPPSVPSNVVKSEEIITSVDRKPFAASLNNLLSQQLAVKDDGQTSPSSGSVGNYPLHKIRRKLSTTSIDSSSSMDSLPLPPKPHSRQASPAPNEAPQRSPTPNSYRPPPVPSDIAVPTASPEVTPNRSHLHSAMKFNTMQKYRPPPPLVRDDSRNDQFATLPKSKPAASDSSDFHVPPLPNRPVEIFPSQTSRSLPQIPPPISRVNNYPNVSINAPPTLRQVPSPSWAGNRPLPSPPKDQHPYILQVQDISASVGRKSPTCCENLPLPPSLAPIDIEVDYEMPQEDEDAEYYFVDEVNPDNYKQQPWYKNVDRKEAQIILTGSQNGAFLVRPGKTDDHECSFSVMYDRRVYNIPVKKAGDKFLMGHSLFDTVVEIVDKFTVSPLVLNGPMNQDLFVTLRRN